MQVTLKAKAPDSRVRRGMDWSKHLGSDTIAESTWEVLEGDVVLEEVAFAGGYITRVWITEGTDETICFVKNKIVTTLNQELECVGRIAIRER